MQRSFDDLGTPLAQTTFCVLDLETTGASAESCGITEIGAVRVRGGELTVEDEELLGETVEAVTCRWCGPSGAVEVQAGADGEVLR